MATKTKAKAKATTKVVATPKKADKFVPKKTINGQRIIASTVEKGLTVKFMAADGCRYDFPLEEYEKL